MLELSPARMETGIHGNRRSVLACTGKMLWNWQAPTKVYTWQIDQKGTRSEDQASFQYSLPTRTSSPISAWDFSPEIYLFSLPSTYCQHVAFQL